jgi:hypothetical protein
MFFQTLAYIDFLGQNPNPSIPNFFKNSSIEDKLEKMEMKKSKKQ